MSNNNDLEILERLAEGGLANIIREFRERLCGKARDRAISILKERIHEYNDINRILSSALRIKKIVGQIDTIIHAYGILAVLPKILQEGEVVERLSLGADNAGTDYDLETNLRVAEFKFAKWRETGNAMRKKSLFKDLFYLVEKDTKKEKYLYVLTIERVKKFLRGRATIRNFVSKNRTLEERFREKYKDQFKTMTISKYYNKHKNEVKIVDLSEIAPEFFKERE